MNILSTLRNHPIVSGVAALVVATVSIAGAINAWGPTRTTFTMENPADYPVFNSITNNPTYGDERNFVTINDVTANTGFKSSVELKKGHTYKVQIYIHNDASEKLNDNGNGKGVALGTTVAAVMPATVNGKADASATITASNTTPAKVWDNAVMTSSEQVELQYVSGSAMLSNHQQQTKLSDSLLNGGVKVGSYDLSGKWYACHGFAGAVTFEFKVKDDVKSDFTMNKQVRKHSETSGGWTKSYAAQPDEVVDFVINYKNTGNVTQENVVVKDTLPAGLTYVAGSTVLANGNNKNGKSINDDVTTKGVNIGTYQPNASAWVRFSAKVASSDKLVCGTNTFKNVASVTTGGGTKSDDAVVTVTKQCTPQPQPVYTCNDMTAEVTKNSYKFSVKYTAANGATYKSTTYKVYDASGKEVFSTANGNGSFNGFTAGTYTVKAFVTVTVNGKDETVTSQACSKQFTIPADTVEKEKVCERESKQIIIINKKDFDSNKHSRTLSDCDVEEGKIKVCVLTDKSIATIKESEFDKKIHSRTLSDCDTTPTTPTIPTTPVVPTTPTTPIAPATPPTTIPSELPQTGIGSVLSVIGAGSLGYAIDAFAVSRRINH